MRKLYQLKKYAKILKFPKYCNDCIGKDYYMDKFQYYLSAKLEGKYRIYQVI